MKTQTSTNYSRFDLETFNRELTRGHIFEIAENMRLNGFKESEAILVYPDPANPRTLQVVDGHHRFLAAKDLGLPIKFKVLPPGSNPTQELLDKVLLQKSWTINDLVDLHAESIGDYSELREFHSSTGIGYCVAAKLYSGGIAGKKLSRALKNGTWRISDYAFASRVAHIVSAIAGWHGRRFASRTGLVNAISALCSVAFFADDYMIAAIDKNAKLLLPVAPMHDNLEQLDRIYNKGRGVMSLPLSETAAAVMDLRRRAKGNRAKYHEFDILREEAK